MIDPTKRNFKIVAGSLLVLTLAWQHVQATRLGYAVEQARRQTHALKGRIGTLQVQLETSLAPAQLSAQAKAMGMVQAGPESLRILDAAGAAPADGTFLSRIFTRSWRALLNT
jgi:hypothetical protein